MVLGLLWKINHLDLHVYKPSSCKSSVRVGCESPTGEEWVGEEECFWVAIFLACLSLMKSALLTVMDRGRTAVSMSGSKEDPLCKVGKIHIFTQTSRVHHMYIIRDLLRGICNYIHKIYIKRCSEVNCSDFFSTVTKRYTDIMSFPCWKTRNQHP